MSDPVTAEEVCADCGLPFLPREERIQTPKGSEHSYMTCTRRMKAYINQLKVEIADLREDCDRGTSEANKFHALWKAAASDLEKCKADFTANASAYVEDLAELKSATPEPRAVQTHHEIAYELFENCTCNGETECAYCKSRIDPMRFDIGVHFEQLLQTGKRKQLCRDALLENCEDMECMICATAICQHGDPLHFHHDGCPACSTSTKLSSQP